MDTDAEMMQKLLDLQATAKGEDRRELDWQIIQLRGNVPPYCYGQDDCMTLALSVCPWRMDCGGECA